MGSDQPAASQHQVCPASAPFPLLLPGAHLVHLSWGPLPAHRLALNMFRACPPPLPPQLPSRMGTRSSCLAPLASWPPLCRRCPTRPWICTSGWWETAMRPPSFMGSYAPAMGRHGWECGRGWAAGRAGERRGGTQDLLCIWHILFIACVHVAIGIRGAVECYGEAEAAVDNRSSQGALAPIPCN